MMIADHKRNVITMKTGINLELLHELREDRGLSISDLANELSYKTPTGYWLLEKGQRKVSVEVLYQLSKLYGLTMEEFLILAE